MNFVLEMENPLFYKEVAEMHRVLYAKFKAVEDMAYSWMDDVLEDAKKAFSNKTEPCILPKTPAAKQKGRGRKAKKTSSNNSRQLFTAECAEDDYVPPAQETGKQSSKASRNKRVAYTSDDDFEDAPSSKVSKVEKSPVRRTTRAGSRAATTSRAKNTRANKGKPTHKSRSQEPVQNLEKMISEDGGQNNELDVTTHEMVEEWTQPAADHMLSAPNIVPSLCKTPIQNFNSMNVKEKAHAYEEIMLISESPVTCTKSAKTSLSKCKDIQTPVKQSLSPRTPTNAPIPQTTPETVIETYDEIIMSTKLPPGFKRDVDDTPTAASDEEDMTPRNSRRSVRKSLKVLPSAAKISAVHHEPEAEQPRARTRLRLKKKKKSEPVDDEVSSVTSDDQHEQTEATIDVSSPQNKRTTRSKSRGSCGLVTDKPDSRVADNMETEDTTDRQKEPESPKPTRSTRTKTRQAHAQPAVQRLRNDEIDSSADDAGSSVDSDGSLRLTRSKIRKPKSQDVDSDTVAGSPAVTRVTRTKTRKRQHEDEPGTESRQPKRSCTGSTTSENENTPKRKSLDSSSEEEKDSPKCPANKVVRPVPSFLHSLNKNSKNPVIPSHLNTTGVKSFIVRNSPAPKLNMKEIQDKRRIELQEKQQKEQERLKKRDEENKKRMDEMRKKREEKMKKVQELKEHREKEERMNRIRIEKRLAEKRQLTQKIREEKLKEDKEKQKMRLQKMEEAEERRKQEDEERRKKLQEQQEQEKMHEAMLQRKKEFEEQERHQKIEDEKRRAVERIQENERERERERERLLKVEEDKQREWQKKKEEKEKMIAAERAERERMDFEKKRERELQMKKEMERIKEQERVRLAEQDRLREEERKRNEEIKKMVDKHNSQLQQNKALPKPEFNKTRSIEEPTVAQPNNDSYEMTPKRKVQASTAENYGIDDLNSGDDTDDDECPRKRIPDWAQGSQLKNLLIRQHFNPPNLDDMFDCIEPPDLNVLFEKKKARFNKRTSSAHWDTPILKPGMLGRV